MSLRTPKPLKPSKMTEETKEQLFDVLYALEDKHAYSDSKIGRTIGDLLAKLERELQTLKN